MMLRIRSTKRCPRQLNEFVMISIFPLSLFCFLMKYKLVSFLILVWLSLYAACYHTHVDLLYVDWCVCVFAVYSFATTEIVNLLINGHMVIMLIRLVRIGLGIVSRVFYLLLLSTSLRRISHHRGSQRVSAALSRSTHGCRVSVQGGGS